MSRILELKEQIQNFLSSQDHSDSPALRQAAAEYAEACRDTNEHLAECARMIAASVLADALRYNARQTPSVTERAHILQLSRFVEWQDLCIKYSWAAPPVLDMKTVAKLENPGDFMELNELIHQWRHVARNGRNDDKVRILRSILVHVDESTKRVWQTNLKAVEPRYFSDLFEKAAAAAEADDLDTLEAVHAKLTSPELLTQPDTGKLKSFTAVLEKKQKSRLDIRKAALLATIGETYSNMDQESLAASLAEWDAISALPVFSAGENELLQVREAQDWLKNRQQEQAKQKQFGELEKLLGEQLDSVASMIELNTTYHTMQNLGFPLNPKLVKRYENEIERQNSELARRHVRRCVYAFLCAGGFAVLLALGIWYWQLEREFSETVSAMDQALQEKNYDAVAALYEKIQKIRPRFAKRSAIIERKQEAEKRKQTEQEERKYFAGLLKDFRSKLEQNMAESKEAKYFLDELVKNKEKLSAEALSELDDLNVKYLNALDMFQEKRDRKFQEESSGILEGLNQCTAAITSEDADLTALERRKNDLAQELDDLITRSGKLTVSGVKSQQQAFQLSEKTFEAALQKEKTRQELLYNLSSPGSFTVYKEAMKKGTGQFPGWFAQGGIYEQAVKDLELASMYMETQPVTPEEISKTIAAFGAMNRKDSPLCRNLRLFTPYDEEKLKVYLDRLEANVLGNSGIKHEYIFTGEAGDNYRFYTKAVHDEEKLKGRKDPLSITLRVILEPGKKPVSLSFGVKRISQAAKTAKKYLLSPAIKNSPKFEKSGIPEKLYADSLNQGGYPLHCEYLENFLVAMRTVSQDQSAVIAELTKQYQLLAEGKFAAMNPYMRRLLAMEIMTMLGDVSLFSRKQTAQHRQHLEMILPDNKADWLNPAEAAKNPDKVRLIENSFKQLDLKKAAEREELIRRFQLETVAYCPLPCAVVNIGKEDIAISFFSKSAAPAELYFLMGPQENTESRFVLLPRSVISSRKIPQELRQYFYNGQILYTSRNPFGYIKMMEKFLAEAKEKQIELDDMPALLPDTSLAAEK